MAINMKKTLMAGAAALTLGGGMLVQSAPAQAQFYYGGGYGGYYARPVATGYYGRGYGYGYGHPYRYGYRRYNNGGAVAAGVIGGLALGALAANAARPAYYGGYPAYRTVGYAPGCYVTRERRVNRFGELVVRRVRVCG